MKLTYQDLNLLWEYSTKLTLLKLIQSNGNSELLMRDKKNWTNCFVCSGRINKAQALYFNQIEPYYPDSETDKRNDNFWVFGYIEKEKRQNLKNIRIMHLKCARNENLSYIEKESLKYNG